jgi:type I restriction enzyme M protein
VKEHSVLPALQPEVDALDGLHAETTAALDDYAPELLHRKPTRENPWTQKLWIYDLSDLDDFIACYFGNVGRAALPRRQGSEAAQQHGPTNRHNRVETERFKSFTCDELMKRDKVNLDIFWLKDDALEESTNLPAPEIIAQEITDGLEAALEQFAPSRRI